MKLSKEFKLFLRKKVTGYVIVASCTLFVFIFGTYTFEGYASKSPDEKNENVLEAIKIENDDVLELKAVKEINFFAEENVINSKINTLVARESINELGDKIIITNDVNENEEEIEKEEQEEQEHIDERILNKNDKMVALTFDDGPSKANTSNIISILKEHNAVATFFEVGSYAQSNKELVLEEYEAGCEIENHSYSHLNMAKSSKAEILTEINKTNDILFEITGERPTFVRPPYGEINKSALEESGMSSILWSVDTRDWKLRNKDKIMNLVKKEEDLDGAVILLHSTHKTTVDTLDELLCYLEDEGYKCVTLNELYEYKYNEEIEEGKVYGYNYFINKTNEIKKASNAKENDEPIENEEIK